MRKASSISLLFLPHYKGILSFLLQPTLPRLYEFNSFFLFVYPYTNGQTSSFNLPAKVLSAFRYWHTCQHPSASWFSKVFQARLSKVIVLKWVWLDFDPNSFCQTVIFSVIPSGLFTKRQDVSPTHFAIPTSTNSNGFFILPLNHLLLSQQSLRWLPPIPPLIHLMYIALRGTCLHGKWLRPSLVMTFLTNTSVHQTLQSHSYWRSFTKLYSKSPLCPFETPPHALWSGARKCRETR